MLLDRYLLLELYSMGLLFMHGTEKCTELFDIKQSTHLLPSGSNV